MRKLYLIFLLTLIFMPCISNEVERAPIYVTPIYNSSPFEINVGQWSDRLLSMNKSNALEIEEELISEINNVSIETLYVFSILLYDLEFKDKAIYWFYSAQLRGKLFYSSIDKNKIVPEAYEYAMAFNSFDQLVGQYVNGYAFGELETLVRILRNIQQEENPGIPLKQIYSKVNFIKQDSIDKNYIEISSGLNGLIDYIKSNEDEIKKQRQENGMEGKY